MQEADLRFLPATMDQVTTECPLQTWRYCFVLCEIIIASAGRTWNGIPLVNKHYYASRFVDWKVRWWVPLFFPLPKSGQESLALPKFFVEASVWEQNRMEFLFHPILKSFPHLEVIPTILILLQSERRNQGSLQKSKFHICIEWLHNYIVYLKFCFAESSGYLLQPW